VYQLNIEEENLLSIFDRLPGYTRLLVKLYKSQNIRKRHKLLLSAGIAYSVSPIELIPGIIPVAGQLDNLLIMLCCLKKVLDAVDKDIREKYLKDTGITMEELKKDIELTRYTLKSIGKGTVKVVTNTVKFIGYKSLHGITKLKMRRPY